MVMNNDDIPIAGFGVGVSGTGTCDCETNQVWFDCLKIWYSVYLVFDLGWYFVWLAHFVLIVGGFWVGF